MSQTFQARLDLVPENPGVYLMKDAEDSIIYVGKAVNLKSRLRSYFQNTEKPSYRIALMVKKIQNFDFIICENELEALVLESGLIKRYQPFYNVLLKDDKDYPYLELNFDPVKPSFKKVFRRSLNAQNKVYFGPYLAAQLHPLLQSIYHIFSIQSCGQFSAPDAIHPRACLHYHIGSCIGTCCGKVSAQAYCERLKKIEAFLKGEYRKVLKDLEQQMKKASESLAFEQAAYFRDQIQGLEALLHKQRVVASIQQNADFLAVAYSELRHYACIQRLEVREGRIVGGNTFFLDHVEHEQEALEEFLIQEYSFFEKTMPKKIQLYLENYPSSQALLELLKKHYGVKILSHTQEKEIWNMAKETAKESLHRKLNHLEMMRTENEQKHLAWESLKKHLNLPQLKRLEAYDISNLGASYYSASMVVFEKGYPKKEAYRQFSLDLEEPNDYLAMSLALERRLKRIGELDFGQKPDLIVVDGGLSHVHLAQHVLQREGIAIPVIGVVKNSKHKTRGLVFPDGHIWELLPVASKTLEERALLQLLTRIQDEMHRRALLGQNKRWKKAQFRYKLEDIEGIGSARRKVILEHFGSLKALEEATLEELEAKLPFSTALCERIYQYFRMNKE